MCGGGEKNGAGVSDAYRDVMYGLDTEGPFFDEGWMRRIGNCVLCGLSLRSSNCRMPS